MTELTVNYDDGSSDTLVSKSAPPSGPSLDDYESFEQVTGLVYNASSPYEVMRVMMDEYMRPVGLKLTNAIFPNRPLIDGKVRPLNKIIIRLRFFHLLWLWIIDLLGERNAAQFDDPGDGNQDTNSEGLDLWDLTADRKHMSAVYSGQVVKVLETLVQSGTKYCKIDAFHQTVQPTRVSAGIWEIDGIAYTRDEHPHLFATRTLIGKISADLVSWQTPTDCNLSIDKGWFGGKGDEDWPIYTSDPPYIQLSNLNPYKRPEFDVILYKDSILVDGSLVPQEGLRVTIDELVYRGSDVFGRVKGDGRYFRLEHMLVRGSIDDRAAYGNGYDWRVFASFPETPGIPYRHWRSVPSPKIGWQRPSLLTDILYHVRDLSRMGVRKAMNFMRRR